MDGYPKLLLPNSIKMMIIGIDVSKNTIDIFEKTSQTTTTIKNDYKKIISFFKKIDKSSIIIYESTGTYSNTLCKAMNDLGFTHYQIHPNTIHNIAKGLCDRNKNDRIDAKKIAEVGKFLLSNLQESDSKSRITTPNSNEINEMYSILSNINSLKSQCTKFKQLKDKEENNIYGNKNTIKFYNEMIDTINGKINDLYKEIMLIIEKMGIKHKFDNIMTIPCINKNSGIEILLLFLDLENKGFTSKDRSKLKAYSGLDCIDHKSGSSINSVHISKRGKKNVRKTLYMACMIWFKLYNHDNYCNTNLGNFFKRMKNKFESGASKRGKSILCAMAKKTLLVAWGVYWNDTNYNSVL